MLILQFFYCKQHKNKIYVYTEVNMFNTQHTQKMLQARILHH